MSDLSLANIGGQLLIDSRLIAERIGIEHKNLRQTVEKYLTELQGFGVLRFETTKPQNGRPERFSYLNEDQAIFLMTLSRNTEKVVQCKMALVQAFRKAKEAIEISPPQPKSLPSAVEYIEARKYLDFRPRDRFTALAEQLLIAEMAGIQNAQYCLPTAEAKHYTTAMLRASQLGYSAKQIDGGVALGKYVKKAIAPDHKDWQGQYQVWQYEVNDELDARIHSFFLTRSL